MSNENAATEIARVADPAMTFETLPAQPDRLDRPGRGAVDLWRFDLDGLGRPDDRCLAPAERERRDRFVRGEDGRRYAASRVLLRRILGAYLDSDPALVPIALGLHGKPALARAGGTPPLEFNLTHSGAQMVLACSDAAAVGVDIEHLDRTCDHAGIARHAFHPNEARALKRRGPNGMPELFFHWWTAKEALLKARGTGLGGGMDTMDFSAWTSGASVEVREPGGSVWRLWRYAGGGCALALAAAPPLLAVRVCSIIGSGARSGAAITRSS